MLAFSARTIKNKRFDLKVATFLDSFQSISQPLHSFTLKLKSVDRIKAIQIFGYQS